MDSQGGGDIKTTGWQAKALGWMTKQCFAIRINPDRGDFRRTLHKQKQYKNKEQSDLAAPRPKSDSGCRYWQGEQARPTTDNINNDGATITHMHTHSIHQSGVVVPQLV